MSRRPPRPTRTYTLFPYPPLFRSVARGEFGERFAKRAADADPVLRRGFEEVERARRRGLQRSQQGAPQAQAHAVVLQVHGRASVSDSGCLRVVRGEAPASHPADIALAALAFPAGLVGGFRAAGLLFRAAAAFWLRLVTEERL